MATNIVYTGHHNPYALVQQAGSRMRGRKHKRRRTHKRGTHKRRRTNKRTKRRLN